MWFKYVLIILISTSIIILVGTYPGVLTSDVAALQFTHNLPLIYHPELLYINITGAVNNPGVYQVAPGTRVLDVVNIAGGFTAAADAEGVASKINLAQKVNDEDKIFIPSSQISTSNISNDKINIQTATADQLDELPGIGAVTAEKIIQNRPYNSIEDLLKVDGISAAKLDKIRDLITLD